MDLALVCKETNDLYRALMANGGAADGVACARYENAAEALARAPRRAALALLADGYPGETTPFDAATFEEALRREVRLYVEFPAWLPGADLAEPRGIQHERAVVASDAFGPDLARGRILVIHGCRFVVPSVAARHHQGRVDDLTETGLLRHEQDG